MPQKQVKLPSGESAVVLYMPTRVLKAAAPVIPRVVRELEKKRGGSHVVVIGHRRMLPRVHHGTRQLSQQRPVSRSLTSVHEATLEDLVYPLQIVGKRTRVKTDQSRLLKVVLSKKERNDYEQKLVTFETVYHALTGRRMRLSFEA